MITHNKSGRLLSVLLMAAALCAPPAFGQRTALTTTTLSVAIPASTAGNQQTITSITVASNSGMVAFPTQQQAQGGLGGPSSGTVGTFLVVDGEVMQPNSINGTIIQVSRGMIGTKATAHNSGATVYVATGRQLVSSNNTGTPPLTGYCNSAFAPVAIPYIDVYTGNTWDCPTTGPFLNTWVVGGMVNSYSASTGNLNPNTIQFVSKTLTLAQLITMNDSAITIIPAQGANTLVEIQSCTLDLKRGSAAFTSGGTVTIGYGTTPTLGAASPAAATIASTVFTTFAASQSITVAGALAVTANSLTLNTPVTISNGSADFATGTGATGVLDCSYRVHSGF